MAKNGPIIVVEDDSDDQEILKEIFEELKINNIVHFFNSAAHALEYLFSTIEKPFLVISDINLPGMSGLQLRQEINKHYQLSMRCIPFIFLSTSSNYQVITHAYEMRAHGFFVKPSSISQLREMLKMILSYWDLSRHPRPE